jgi:hypothetical protein
MSTMPEARASALPAVPGTISGTELAIATDDAPTARSRIPRTFCPYFMMAPETMELSDGTGRKQSNRQRTVSAKKRLSEDSHRVYAIYCRQVWKDEEFKTETPAMFGECCWE